MISPLRGSRPTARRASPPASPASSRSVSVPTPSHLSSLLAVNQGTNGAEDGHTEDHCGYTPPWQAAARDTEGIAGDQFWQWGDELSTGPAHDDGFTIYFEGGEDYQCMVADHVAAIEAM